MRSSGHFEGMSEPGWRLAIESTGAKETNELSREIVYLTSVLSQRTIQLQAERIQVTTAAHARAGIYFEVLGSIIQPRSGDFEIKEEAAGRMELVGVDLTAGMPYHGSR